MNSSVNCSNIQLCLYSLSRLCVCSRKHYLFRFILNYGAINTTALLNRLKLNSLFLFPKICSIYFLWFVCTWLLWSLNFIIFILFYSVTVTPRPAWSCIHHTLTIAPFRFLFFFFFLFLGDFFSSFFLFSFIFLFFFHFL